MDSVNTVTHGELFAGISGFGLGFEANGIETLWAVDIDKNCQRVQKYHYPDRLILDDICTVCKHNLPYVDIISFGSPCQDLSLAGKREGLKGERSGLFYQAIRVVKELRPAIAIWENVPGAISSNSGRDFLAVITAFHECGAVDIGWRVIDAQYCGVPQRRRRIFLVADFRERRVGQILFKSESVSRDTTKSREKGKGITSGTQTSPAIQCSGRPGSRRDDEESLIAFRHQASVQQDLQCGEMSPTIQHNQTAAVYENHGADSRIKEVDSCPTITERAGTGGNNLPLVAVTNPGGVTLKVGDKSGSITTQVGSETTAMFNGVLMRTVRRLTPRECERLQGFPDNWTLADGISDSARYRMLGNAVNVAVSKRIGYNIATLDKE